MKKAVYIIYLLLSISCQNNRTNELEIGRLLEDNIVLTDSAEFKTEDLQQIILRNDQLLGINHKDNGNDSSRLQKYNASIFTLVAKKSCRSYKHLYILKKVIKGGREQLLGSDIIPYVGLYLLILDSQDIEIKTIVLSEKIHSMGMTPLEGRTKSNLTEDS